MKGASPETTVVTWQDEPYEVSVKFYGKECNTVAWDGDGTTLGSSHGDAESEYTSYVNTETFELKAATYDVVTATCTWSDNTKLTAKVKFTLKCELFIK